jgi:hypothetical protein
MGVLDFLFEGKPPPQVTTYGSTTTQLPPWLEAYTQGLISRSNVIAGEPFQAYPGARIAPLPQDTQRAFDVTRETMGQWQPAVTGAMKPFDQATFEQFRSPYIGGVVDEIARLGNRNLTENILPSIQDNFIAAGQRGSSRAGEFSNRAVRDVSRDIAGRQAQALQASFDSAMGAYDRGVGRSLGAAQIGQDLGLRQAAALSGIGDIQQGQAQRNLDLGYQDFLEQREFPRTNVGFLNSALRGVPYSSTASTMGTGPSSVYQPSPLAQIAGLGTGAAGIYQLGKQFKWWGNQGGRVPRRRRMRRYRDGGRVRPALSYLDKAA